MIIGNIVIYEQINEYIEATNLCIHVMTQEG
jgi:hypothetical protein